LTHAPAKPKPVTRLRRDRQRSGKRKRTGARGDGSDE
jgi:hypothetical protein